MNYYNQNQPTPPPFGQSGTVAAQVNTVLKKVYVRMFIGLLVTAFCALGVSSSPAALQFFIGNRFVYWGMFIAMLAMAFIIPPRIARMKTSTVLICFLLFSAMMGTSLSVIFIAYELGTIVYTFFITAGVFLAMSVYGYFTKANLAKMGTYCIMALFGIIIASLVNIFLHSSGLEWIISIVGVLIFVGLTAYDTQMAKQLSAANLDPAMSDKLATLCSLNLYLDFINLFLFLLQILGGSNRN